MRVKHGDHVHEAPTAAGIVEQMRQHNFEETSSTSAYMVAVSKRIKTAMGKSVSTETPENFIADLIGAGFLEEVSDAQ